MEKCIPDLFKDDPIFKGFQTFDEPILLQVPLADYFKVFNADTILRFNKDRNPDNKTVQKGEWFSPPEAKYATFQGRPCTKQMTTKLTSYGSFLYPSVPNTTQSMVCGETDTSLLLWDVIINEGVPYSSVSEIHVVNEVRKASEESVLIRS